MFSQLLSSVLLFVCLAIVHTPERDAAMERLFAIGDGCEDSTRAESTYVAIGQFLATTSDSVVLGYGYSCRLIAARTLGRLDDMQAAADSAFRFQPDDAAPLQMAAGELLDRGVRLEIAEDDARRAVQTFDRTGAPIAATYERLTLGQIQVLRGECAPAIANLERVVTAACPDSQLALLHLGRAHEELGEAGAAIDAWIRARAVFGGDSADVRWAERPLDSLFIANYGSLAGLREREQAAREASRIHTLESRRDGRRSPPWRLLDLRDSTYRHSDYRHGVVVLDFWATSCEPCREALPRLQALADELGGRGVRFQTVCVEGQEPAKIRRRVLDFLDENGITLAAAAGDSALVARYRVQMYPTTLVIQRGRVRYRNPGFQEAILREEITSLLAKSERPGRAARREASAARR